MALDVQQQPVKSARDVPGMMKRLVSTLSDEEISMISSRWSSSSCGGPIRVGTVCSGTDAPIIALQLLLDALEERRAAIAKEAVNSISNGSSANGQKIEVEHIFSCESTPFKRDFIEATSNPALLFNDVAELSSGKGKCHDGKTRDVPKNVTVLIAGTECVDFSSLTTTPKGLSDNGRSGITFWATLDLVKLQRPALVILENVAKCPAKEMAAAFEEAGYAATHTKLCTSDFLLPQTRARTYFLFVNKEHVETVDDYDWVTTVERMGSKRPPLPDEKVLTWQDFLRSDTTVDEDDSSCSSGKKTKRRGKPLSASGGTKWLAEVKSIEGKEGLTPYHEEDGRPYTKATKNVPALNKLPDRAKMRLDVQHKRALKVDIDPLITPLLWNPAQQLHFTDAKPWLRKVAPCVTPKHEWIVSSRKAPLTGRECLDLQGIPISDDEAKFFDDNQLRDLAGNAMSSTVVGSAMIAAFLSCTLMNDPSDGGNVRQSEKRSLSVEDARYGKRSRCEI